MKNSLNFIPKGQVNNNPALAPNRRQAIIRTNADPVHWHIYAALRGDELNHADEKDACGLETRFLLWLSLNGWWIKHH